jgi:serine/threonine protein kinase
LYSFEGIPDRRGAFLTRSRFAGIDVQDGWSQTLSDQPAPGLGWIFERLRESPPAVDLPTELALHEKLQPSSTGKLIGHQLGQNRLLSVIARGGFGTIYDAKGPNGERVAVKVIESPQSALHVARFVQEFEKLKQASQHPGILQCYDSDVTLLQGRQYPWYSMEFALGGDLTQRIEERRASARPLHPWEVADMRAAVVEEFTAVVAAVAELHMMGFVHRDIKPGNILIMSDGSLRLSDFGLVKNLEPSDRTLLRGACTSTGAVLGTRRYMAPEQERGLEVGMQADTYSLGILLIELALSNGPEPDCYVTSGSTVRNCAALGKLPKGLRKFIGSCTDVDPKNRPTNATSLREEFAAIVRASRL